MGDVAGAQASAQAGINVATEAKNEEYIRLNTQLLKEATSKAKASIPGPNTTTRTVTRTETRIEARPRN